MNRWLIFGLMNAAKNTDQEHLKEMPNHYAWFFTPLDESGFKNVCSSFLLNQRERVTYLKFA
jgi:hypothetical protein